MNDLSQCKRIFFIHTHRINTKIQNNPKVLSLLSALIILIISYTCNYAHKFPRLYLTLSSYPTSD